jgi:hypothetical protein
MKKSVARRMSLRSELSMQIKRSMVLNFSVDDDVKYDKDSVEDREVPLVSELNTGWSSKRKYLPSN